jgi:DNA excision repair protein ERCC-3
VFCLIGPKRYDVPWRALERQGWIAPVRCYEIRVPLPEEGRLAHARAQGRDRYRLASENPAKLPLVRRLVSAHRDEQVLVIGQYLRQVRAIAEELKAPLLTGSTPNRERQELYSAFRQGRVRTLVLSKVANMAVDLPSAGVAIQVSGAFGSRQEEAQRLGRILRPKPGGQPAHFYSLVSRGTREEDYSARRQLFLTEQGYEYQVLGAEEIASHEAIGWTAEGE